MAVYNYDSKDTSIIVKDVHITGLGEDMISFEKDEDFFEPTVGGQGDVVKNVKNHPLGKAHVFVQPTSPQKKFLMELKNEQEPFPIWAINKSLGERTGGAMANLLSFPEVARGTTAEDMEFVFQIFDFTSDTI